jgi:CRP-like cAMP-binding protein
MQSFSQSASPVRNRLLAALPRPDLSRLLQDLDPVPLTQGQVIYEAGETMTHVYFPTSSIISLLYLTEAGVTVEIALTGYEGVVGVGLFTGASLTSNRVVVLSAGTAFRMTASKVQSEFAMGGAFQHQLLRYTHALVTQISLNAVCNRLHYVEQQLCRWLLLSFDRTRSDELTMTHDLISDMLGVRRAGITVAAQKLQEKKLISYVRGTIKLIDRVGLESMSCECYRVVKDEYDRLLGQST